MDKGGRTKRIADEYEGLRRLGFSVLLVVFSEPPVWVRNKYPHSADWLILPKGSATVDWRLLLALYRAARTFRADILHAHCEGSALYAGVASRLLRGKCIATVHRSDLRYYQASWRHKVFYRFVDAFVAVSRERCSQMEVALGVGSRPLRVIHWGVDSTTEPTDDDQAVARGALALPEDARILLSIGHLGEIKGHDDAIAALAQIREAHPTVHLYLAGDGSDDDYARLRAQIAAAGVDGAVTLLGQVTDVDLWFSACDLFLLASREEAFGLVFIEAGLRRKPTIATCVGGIPEIIVSGETGILVEPQAPRQIGDAVLALLADPSRTRVMGLAAYERVRQKFSLRRKVADLAEFFAETRG